LNFARQSGDTARNFKCGTDSVEKIGKSGPASEAMSRLTDTAGRSRP
jgi:hypothetical protein